MRERDPDRVRDTEHTTIIHSGGGGGGGGGTILIALLVLIILAVLLFFAFGGSADRGAEGVDINVNLDAPEVTVPEIDVPDVTIESPETPPDDQSDGNRAQ